MVNKYQNRIIDDYIVGEQAIAIQLNVSVSTLRRYKETKGLPMGKFCGQVVVERSSLKNWVKQQIVY